MGGEGDRFFGILVDAWWYQTLEEKSGRGVEDVGSAESTTAPVVHWGSVVLSYNVAKAITFVGAVDSVDW